MNHITTLLVGTALSASLFAGYQAVQPAPASTHQAQQVVDPKLPRTLVVQISSADTVSAVNGLLFALHSIRNARGEFGGQPFRLQVKVSFGGAGVLNASTKILHPEIRIPTLPDDPVKTPEALVDALLAEGVQMRASGFALKSYGVDPTDLMVGVMPAGPSDQPRFIASPESFDTFVVNF